MLKYIVLAIILLSVVVTIHETEQMDKDRKNKK